MQMGVPGARCKVLCLLPGAAPGIFWACSVHAGQALEGQSLPTRWYETMTMAVRVGADTAPRVDTALAGIPGGGVDPGLETLHAEHP